MFTNFFHLQVDRKLEGFFRTSHSHIVKSAIFLNGRLWTADVGGVVLVCLSLFFFVVVVVVLVVLVKTDSIYFF